MACKPRHKALMHYLYANATTGLLHDQVLDLIYQEDPLMDKSSLC